MVRAVREERFWLDYYSPQSEQVAFLHMVAVGRGMMFSIGWGRSRTKLDVDGIVDKNRRG